MAFKQEAFAFSMGSTLSVRKCSRALRKRTTCLVSSVSFVSRFLPMNKPGLHPPAAARHPSSKHKARCSSSRDAGKLDATLSPCLSTSLFSSLSLSVSLCLSFSPESALFSYCLLSHLHVTAGSSASCVLIYVGPAPLLVRRFLGCTLCLPSRTKNASCVFNKICRALVS